MVFDLSSLEKAVNSFEGALSVAMSEQISAMGDSNLKNTVRAGVIQNFEFTYELCWKFIKRWLEKNVNRESIDGVTRKELFRLAAESRLISNTEAWFEYHEARNETAHTYNEQTAEDVFNVAKRFLQDAKGLLKVLKERND